jgi:hypothetical protein
MLYSVGASIREHKQQLRHAAAAVHILLAESGAQLDSRRCDRQQEAGNKSRQQVAGIALYEHLF